MALTLNVVTLAESALNCQNCEFVQKRSFIPSPCSAAYKALWEHTVGPDASWRQVEEKEDDSPLEQNFDADAELFGRKQISLPYLCMMGSS